METVNINKSSKEDLIKVVHIGTRRADLIIEKRSTHAFKDLYELSIVKGFGKKRINDIISEGILKCK
jgi:DNA uptake protein ComE-like DNA-binding protein